MYRTVFDPAEIPDDIRGYFEEFETVCGAPRVRVTVKGEPDRAWQASCGADSEGNYTGQATKDFITAGAEDASAVKARILESMRPKTTLGWAFSCACAGKPPRLTFPEARFGRKRHQRAVSGDHRRRVARHLAAPEGFLAPCRVLDPFAGSGTTLAVAHGLGLDAIGVELQANYAELAVQRVQKAGGTLVVEKNELAALTDAQKLPKVVEDRGEGLEPWPEEVSGWPETEVVPPFAWADGDRG